MVDAPAQRPAEQVLLAVEQLPGAVVATDLQGRVTVWSHGAEQLYGWSAAEALGVPVRSLMLHGAEDLADQVRGRLEQGQVWSGEFPTTRKDGQALWVYVSNAPMRDGAGRVVGVIGVSLDLSEQRRSADRLADRGSRLGQVIQALGSALTAQQVVEVVLGQGLAALGVEAGAVLLVEAGRLRVAGSRGYEDALVAVYQGMDLARHTPLTDVARTGRSRRTNDPGELAAAYPAVPHSALSTSFAGLPLEVDGRVLGTMSLSSTRPGAFPDEEMAFLTALARSCAQALERGRLFAAEREARRRTAFLAEASRRLSASLDYQATLDAVAALAVPAAGDWCSVHLLDERGQPQLVAVHHKDPERGTLLRELFERYPPQPDRGAGVGQAVGEHRLVHHRSFPDAELEAIARDDGHLQALRRLRMGSGLAVPLQVQGRTTGVLTVTRDEVDAYTDDDLVLVADLASRMAVAVDNAVRYRRERATAVALQRSLLPRRLPLLPGLRTAHRYLPGTAGTDVGGDWYDVLALPGGLVGLAIGDVMGRGVEAAAMMGQLRAALRAYAMVEARPGHVLGLLDAAVTSLGQRAITTCLYGVLDPVDGVLRLASAGHLPPLLADPSGAASYVGLDPAPPLGVGGDVAVETVVQVPEGGVLLLFTDGLVEGRHQPVEQGMAVLRQAVAGAPLHDPEALCEHLLRATGRDGRPDDDSALLAVGRSGTNEGSVR